MKEIFYLVFLYILAKLIQIYGFNFIVSSYLGKITFTYNLHDTSVKKTLIR